jgi:hypothetical protein
MAEYKIEIRATKEEEIPAECFLEDISRENFESHLHELVADINDIDEIVIANLHESEIYISTTLDIKILKNKLKHLFSSNFCHIRFIEMQEILI